MKPVPAMRYVADIDNASLSALCGPTDENIRQIEVALGVSISRRGHEFRITGDKASSERALLALSHFAKLVESRDEPLTVDQVQWYFVGEATPEGVSGEEAVFTPLNLKTRRRDLQGRTANQREYLEHILSHDISFGVGPAGTAKTYLAVACAVDPFARCMVERIVLTRPAVEAGERLGFLPGDLSQKVDPYLRPLYDALFDLMGFDKAQRLMDRQSIEVAPLAYMRGRTLNNAFVILDEAQNTTPEQMKMFLTRIGFGTKAVITGDVTQIDLPKGVPSGLKQATRILEGVPGIAITHFTAGDVVRHPLVAKIVRAYEKEAEREEKEQAQKKAQRAQRDDRVLAQARQLLKAQEDKESDLA